MDASELDHHRGGSGEPLVLLHGIGHTWRGWKPMLPPLEESFDVLAVDLPGFGHSPPLPPGLDSTPEALADAVERVMDEAGFETAHLSGNSLGGWVAPELARRGRARTCVPISPAGLAHGRERDLGVGILRGMRWLARNAAPNDVALRSPIGRTLFAGPTLGRPWRADPGDLIEQRELFTTLFRSGSRHAPTRARAPARRPYRDPLPGADPVGHARRDPDPPPGATLRATHPRLRAALLEGPGPRTDVGRPRAAGARDHGLRQASDAAGGAERERSGGCAVAATGTFAGEREASPRKARAGESARPRANGDYVVARAARSGAGVSAAATITRTKAKLWSTIPSGSLGIGSPNTRMPPLMAETLAAALVRVITGTASPFCRPRADA